MVKYCYQPSPASLRIVKQVVGGSSSSPFTVTVAGPNSYNVITTVTTSAARVITNLMPHLHGHREQPALPHRRSCMDWHELCGEQHGRLR